ncbi:MAG: LysE family transporter [Caldisericota bacterium]|nr:LysE family transporter [Caldisericota bacterium]
MTDTGIALLPALSYAIVSIFTPGPNNVTASSLGMRIGYRRTIGFICGVVTGFFVIMLAAGLLTEVLVSAYERMALILRIVGVGYLLYLAYSLLRSSIHTHGASEAGSRYRDGLLLQLVNPKVILFALTMYATLLAPLTSNPLAVVLSALVMAGLAFVSTSLWALLGSAIQRFIGSPKVKVAYTAVMVLMLLYAAWSVAFS